MAKTSTTSATTSATTPATFGDWLSDAIDEQLVSRTSFADEAHIPRSTLYEWLSGKSFPQGPHVVRLARRLGIDRRVIDGFCRDAHSRGAA